MFSASVCLMDELRHGSGKIIIMKQSVVHMANLFHYIRKGVNDPNSCDRMLGKLI